MRRGAKLINVMVVSASWHWRSAITHELAGKRGVNLVAACTDVAQALHVLGECRVDVALVDEAVGDQSGLQLARVASARGCTVATALIVASRSAWTVEQGRAAGVRGFVHRDDLTDGQDVADVVLTLAAGGRVVTPHAEPDTCRSRGLTSSEREIVRCLEEGMGTDDIATHMSLGRQTVRNYIRRIGMKWGVSGRVEIVAYASRSRELVAA